jgi:hypothetical protein
MSTLGQLVTLAKGQLDTGNGSVWADADIEAWAREAIDEFSNYRPLSSELLAEATSDAQTLYNLGVSVLTVNWVEIGGIAVLYEKRQSAHWGDGGKYYFVHPNNADGDVFLELSPTAAALVSTGTSLVMTAMLLHNSDALTDDPLTVHSRYNFVLVAGIRARAYQQRMAHRFQQLTNEERKGMQEAADRAQEVWRTTLESIAPLTVVSSFA